MVTKKPRVIFMGTSDFAAVILKSLVGKFIIPLVVTQPDKEIGRKQQLNFSDVKKVALQENLPLAQPTKIKKNSEFLQQLTKLQPDIIIVAAYGKILPESIINLPKHGCLNVHASLLPKYRGASPIQSALLAGEKETGITIMLMDQEMDTGDIVAQERLKIYYNDDFNSLKLRLSKIGATLLNQVIKPYIADEINLEIQDDDEATYCAKITTDMGKISWKSSAEEIYNKIRALSSTTGVYTNYHGKRLLILKAQIHNETFTPSDTFGTVNRCAYDKDCYLVKTTEDSLKLLEVQLEGKKPAPIKDFINGHRDFIGQILE